MVDRQSSESEILTVVRSFYFGEIDPLTFFDIICLASDVYEKFFGEEVYGQLLTFNFSFQEDIKEAKSLILRMYKHYSDNSLYEDRVLDIVDDALIEKIKLDEACRKLANLQVDGSIFIPTCFEAYSGEFERGISIYSYKDRVIQELLQLKKSLTK